MANLSLLLLYFPYALLFEQIMIVKNKLRAAFVFDLLSLTAIISIFYLATLENIETVALYRGLIGICVTLVLAFYIKFITRFSGIFSFVSIIFIGLIAVISSFITATLNNNTEMNPIVSLILNIFIYSAMYLVITMIFNWMLHKKSKLLQSINNQIVHAIIKQKQ